MAFQTGSWLSHSSQEPTPLRSSLREFHDEVLKSGSMPLSLLERVVDDYIARELGATP